MKSVFLFTFFTLFCIPLLHSQSYKPIDTADTSLRKEYALRFDQKTKEYTTALKDNYSNKVSSKITADFKEFSKDFTKEINDGSFVFDKKINDYVNGILTHLRENNTDIPTNIDILIAKNNSLNAFCIPNNTFVLNMGLFYWLENEEQLAPVISHELGHRILEHTTKNKKKAFEEANSNQTKQDIRNLALIKYGKYDQAFELFKSKLYVSKEAERKQEFEADSLGYEIYRKSKYAKSEFLNALNLMARYDTIKPKGLKIEIYKTMFDLPNQKFDEKWLLKEDFSKYNYDLFKEKVDLDSISTHPETIDRITRITELFPEMNDKIKTEESAAFKELAIIAGLEIVPNLYKKEKYGDGIYACLLSLQTSTTHQDYYKKWLGNCFQKIYEGRKNYTLNRYLERIEPKRQSESYQQFLNFIWNLKLNEIKAIADYYSK